MKTSSSSVGASAIGKAKFSAIGAGPIAGIVIRKPKPGATRNRFQSMLHILFHRAEAEEERPVQHVVGRQREQIFERIDPLKSPPICTPSLIGVTEWNSKPGN